MSLFYSGERRKALFDCIKDACKDLGGEGHIIEQEEIVDFITGPTLKYQWTSQLLPRESNFMENTMLATHTLIPQLVYRNQTPFWKISVFFTFSNP